MKGAQANKTVWNVNLAILNKMVFVRNVSKVPFYVHKHVCLAQIIASIAIQMINALHVKMATGKRIFSANYVLLAHTYMNKKNATHVLVGVIRVRMS